MHKLNSGVRRIPAAAKAGLKGNWNGKHRNRPGYWFGVLKRAVREDCEERGEPPDLAVADVLAWADAFLARTGDWPAHDSGPIPEAPGETWLLVAAALALGLRGFPCGGSIPRFLDEHRGRYNPKDQKFTVNQVLAWADAWYARTGDWPYGLSGDIPGSGGINWNMVDTAFRFGRGMLPSGTSLGRFLADRRGVVRFPPFTEEQILAWADAHHRQTGKWPIPESGPISDAPEETWYAVNSALKCRHAWSPRWFVARPTARRAAPGETSLLLSAAHDSASPRLGRRLPRTNRAMAHLHFRACPGSPRRALGVSALGGVCRAPRTSGRFDDFPVTVRTPRDPHHRLCAAASDLSDPRLGRCLSRPRRPMASRELRTCRRVTR